MCYQLIFDFTKLEEKLTTTNLLAMVWFVYFLLEVQNNKSLEMQSAILIITLAVETNSIDGMQCALVGIVYSLIGLHSYHT